MLIQFLKHIINVPYMITFYLVASLDYVDGSGGGGGGGASIGGNAK